MESKPIAYMSTEEKAEYLKTLAEGIQYASQAKLSILKSISENTDPKLLELIVKDIQKFEYAYIALFDNVF